MKFRQILVLLSRIVFILFFCLLVYGILSAIKGLNFSVLLTILMIVLFCVWGLLVAFVGPYVGSPRNTIFESDIVLQKEIFIVEVSPNVWKMQNNGVQFDMTGWLWQKHYIAKLIVGIICLKSYNRNKQSALSLPFGTQTTNLEKITLVFINSKGQKKLKTIVRKNKILKGLSLRFRFLASLKSTPTSQTKYNDFKHYKIEVEDCFKFL